MPKATPAQQNKTEKVMHEYKEGTLKSGPGGKGGKVKSRKQAIAIAMSEAGTSKDSKKKSSSKKSSGAKKSTTKKSTTKKSTAKKPGPKKGSTKKK